MTVVQSAIKHAQTLFDTYQHLTEQTLYKLLKQPHGIARSKGIEFDDLLQYASIGLWTACTTYKDKSRFETYAINHIRWAILKGLNEDCAQFGYREDSEYRLDSIDRERREDDNRTLHESIADIPQDITNSLINTYETKKHLEQLTPRQQEIVKFKADGWNESEIARMIGISKQAVNQSYRNITNKFKKVVD